MIIDGHNYCFPQMDLPQGYDTLDEKMRMLQSEYGGHYQPVWRVRDRKVFDNSVLVDPETGELRDIRWTRHNGNIAWEYEGEVYAKQHTPPMLHNLECTPEVMLAEMDYAGIDMGVLHTYPTMGHPTHLNAYMREASPPGSRTGSVAPSTSEKPRYPTILTLPSRPWTGNWRRVGWSGTSSSPAIITHQAAV